MFAQRMMRDTDKSRVYAAEQSVLTETIVSDRLGFDGVQHLGNRLWASDWWMDIVRSVPLITAARADAQSSWAITQTGHRDEIRLSPAGDTCRTLCHEAAHLAHSHAAARDRSCEGAAHGSWFRSMHVDVLALMCGQEISDRLRGSYLAAGLDVPERVWTAPVVRPGRGLYGRWLYDQSMSNLAHVREGLNVGPERTPTGAIPL